MSTLNPTTRLAVLPFLALRAKGGEVVAQLKRAALLFDHVCESHVEMTLNDRALSAATRGDFEQLVERGVILGIWKPTKSADPKVNALNKGPWRPQTRSWGALQPKAR